MLFAVILLLADKGILTEEEAKLWWEKLRNTSFPADFESAQANIKRIKAEIEKELTFLD